MGALVGKSQREDVMEVVEELSKSSELVLGGLDNFQTVGVEDDKGAFMAPTLLHCADPLNIKAPHELEAFGPVSTIMPYNGIEEAIELAKMGKGSLAGSVYTYDGNNARDLILGTAAYHGRMLVIDRDCAKESTGHGSPLPNLVHGGPGRAGGGEELGGVRAIKHYMQRTAIQGSPTALMKISNEYVRGAKVKEDRIHPFRNTSKSWKSVSP